MFIKFINVCINAISSFMLCSFGTSTACGAFIIIRLQSCVQDANNTCSVYYNYSRHTSSGEGGSVVVDVPP